MEGAVTEGGDDQHQQEASTQVLTLVPTAAVPITAATVPNPEAAAVSKMLCRSHIPLRGTTNLTPPGPNQYIGRVVILTALIYL